MLLLILEIFSWPAEKLQKIMSVVIEPRKAIIELLNQGRGFFCLKFEFCFQCRPKPFNVMLFVGILPVENGVLFFKADQLLAKLLILFSQAAGFVLIELKLSFEFFQLQSSEELHKLPIFSMSTLRLASAITAFICLCRLDFLLKLSNLFLVLVGGLKQLHVGLSYLSMKLDHFPVFQFEVRLKLFNDLSVSVLLNCADFVVDLNLKGVELRCWSFVVGIEIIIQMAVLLGFLL